MNPLKKENSRTELAIACLKRSWYMHLKDPSITHTVESLLLELGFHTEDPGGMINTVKYSCSYTYLSQEIWRQP